ncbi:MAG: hypothetical protein LBC84_03320 [Prevotellaceae bacterium]|jgi:alpha-tubulin suppressor-like RCC1 family protein|nr:hypothetical protein [Prevotellaceae bacterium]
MSKKLSLLVLMAGLVLSGCTSTFDCDSSAILLVEPDVLEFTTSGQSLDFTVLSSLPWMLEDIPSGFTFDKVSGGIGTTLVTVTENGFTSSVPATVWVKATNGAKVMVTLDFSVIRVEPSVLYFDPENHTQTFIVTSAQSWEVVGTHAGFDFDIEGSGPGVQEVSVHLNGYDDDDPLVVWLETEDGTQVSVTLVTVHFIVEPTSLNFASYGDIDHFTVKSNVKWELVDLPNFFTFSTLKGNPGTTVVTVTESGFVGTASFETVKVLAVDGSYEKVELHFTLPVAARLYDYITGGYEHSVALKQDGSVWVWGRNFMWALGDQAIGGKGDALAVNRSVPARIINEGITTIAAGGFHTLAIDGDGVLWGWGYNAESQLTYTDGNYFVKTPTKITGIGKKIKAVSGGAAFSLALDEDGALWGWGNTNWGQMGYDNGAKGLQNPATMPQTVPLKIMEGVKTMVAGGFHVLALKEDGTLWSWGSNINGQTGNGGAMGVGMIQYTPVQISTSGPIKSIAAGYNHSVMLLEDGSVWTWGRNLVPGGTSSTGGALGIPTVTNSINLPQQIIAPGSTVVSIGAGDNQTFVLYDNGQLWACGNNYRGQLGDNTTIDKWSLLHVATNITAGVGAKGSPGCGKFTFAFDKDDNLWSWGDNSYGQLGNGESGVNNLDFSKDQHLPVQVLY